MAHYLHDCGTVKFDYFSKDFVEKILLACESDAFSKTYHVSSILELSEKENSCATVSDKHRVRNLTLNKYVWLRFKK